MYILQYVFVFIFIIMFPQSGCETYPYIDQSTCQENEYFNAIRFKCFICPSAKNLKPSNDRLSCMCNDESKLVAMNYSEFPSCERCPTNTFPSEDQTACLTCYNTKGSSDRAECKKCQKGMIFVERELNGTFRKTSYCEKCSAETVPNTESRQCIECGLNKVKTANHNCTCTSKTRSIINGDCIPTDVLFDWPDERNSYTIEYKSGVKVLSHFFQKHLHTSVMQCKVKNSTACQILANMCTMLLFHEKYQGSPCKMFLDPKFSALPDSEVVPRLFYGEAEALAILNRRKILTKYTPARESQGDGGGGGLRLMVSQWSAEGRWRGLAAWPRALAAAFSCPEAGRARGAPILTLGAPLRRECAVRASRLLRAPVAFLEPFVVGAGDAQMQGEGAREPQLHPLPVLIKDMRPTTLQHNNKGDEPSQWLLVRRFFLVDSVSGREAATEAAAGEETSPEGETWADSDGRSATPQVVRYLRSCHIRVRLEAGGGAASARVSPPLLELRYAEASQQQLREDALLPFDLAVSFHMDRDLARHLEVCAGVLGGVAGAWALLRAWGDARRGGRAGVDAQSLGALAALACGSLALALFATAAGAAVHVFAFYKAQSVPHALLPAPRDEHTLWAFLVSALVLQAFHVCWLLWRQLSVDVFFIDWERPRAVPSVAAPTPAGGAVGAGAGTEVPVSVWRQHFVANEWSELQAKRRSNVLVQLALTLFILKVIGMEHWALWEPWVRASEPDPAEGVPRSFTCRVAVALLAHAFAYLAQRLFLLLIYERYINNEVQQFVDICSMANISVFIFAQDKFGYYIHGRSAHGFADTDAAGIARQLQREEQDLCGHRGLLPGTDLQTFSCTVPAALRAFCRRAALATHAAVPGSATKRPSMAPGVVMGTGPGVTTGDRAAAAHQAVTKFLTAFLEHALVDLDYEVKERVFSESLLDMEFSDSGTKATFYKDVGGRAWTRVLLGGHEEALATLDLMLFCLWAATGDWLAAALAVAVTAKVVACIRFVGGKRNLARKTLIDERFLI